MKVVSLTKFPAAKIMNATLLKNQTVAAPVTERRQLDRLLAPLDQIAERSAHIISKSLGQFDSEGRTYSLPPVFHGSSKLLAPPPAVSR